MVIQRFRRKAARLRSLRVAILLPLAIVVLLGFLASGTLYVLSSRAAVRDVVERLVLETTQNLESRFSRLLDSPRHIGITIAEFVRLQEGAAVWTSLYQRIFYSQLKDVPELSIVSIGFADGEYVEAQRMPDGTIQVGRAGRATGGALESWTCDEEGAPRTLASSRPGYDPRTRPWYLSSARARRPVWSGVYPYYTNLELAVGAGIPILEGGEVRAVVSVTVTLRSIAAFLASVPEARSGLLAVVDRYGSMIAVSDGTAPAFLPDGSLVRAFNSANPLLARAAALLGQSPGGYHRILRFEMDGRRYIAGAADVEQQEWDLGWRSIIVLPESVFMSRLTESDVRSSAVFVLLLAAATALSWLMAGKLTKPLSLLEEAVGDLARGDFSGEASSTVRSLADRRDEIGALAASFEDMRKRLSETFDSLKANLAEKEVLLKEVHHRVKNNLQVISSMLSIQAGELREPAALEAFAACQERIQAMAFVHEDVYQSGVFSEVDMDNYLRKICGSLHWSRRGGEPGMEIRAGAENIALPLSRAIPCGLIVNELAANALKHAFPDGRAGSLVVSMSRDEGGYLLVVEDDGVGLAEGAPEAQGGIGRKLVSSLVAQLRGRMSHGPGRGGSGLRVEIRFEG